MYVVRGYSGDQSWIASRPYAHSCVTEAIAALANRWEETEGGPRNPWDRLTMARVEPATYYSEEFFS